MERIKFSINRIFSIWGRLYKHANMLIFFIFLWKIVNRNLIPYFPIWFLHCLWFRWKWWIIFHLHTINRFWLFYKTWVWFIRRRSDRFYRRCSINCDYFIHNCIFFRPMYKLYSSFLLAGRIRLCPRNIRSIKIWNWTADRLLTKCILRPFEREVRLPAIIHLIDWNRKKILRFGRLYSFWYTILIALTTASIGRFIHKAETNWDSL